MFNTSHILVLETKCIQSCLHTFLLKSSYYNDHEQNINNLNFIKSIANQLTSFRMNFRLTTLSNLSIILLNIKQ